MVAREYDYWLLDLDGTLVDVDWAYPRSVFDETKLEELARSIRAQGVVQPIVVRQTGAGEAEEYELIAGERRWRAARMAGLDTIPAVVRNVPDEVSVALALIENIQREDLNPLEEATALRRLIDEFRMTHREAADAVGRSRAAVSNLLRLLELMQEVKDLVDSRMIEMGHARALLALDPGLQVQAAREVVRRRLSVRDTEALVRRLQRGAAGPGYSAPAEPSGREVLRAGPLAARTIRQGQAGDSLRQHGRTRRHFAPDRPCRRLKRAALRRRRAGRTAPRRLPGLVGEC